MVATVHKPVLIVIAGPNGSGKTTITTQILHHEWMENAIYINPDQIANDKFGDWNSQEAIMQSVNYCEALREECLREKIAQLGSYNNPLIHPHTPSLSPSSARGMVRLGDMVSDVSFQ